MMGLNIFVCINQIKTQSFKLIKFNVSNIHCEQILPVAVSVQ